LGDFYSFKFVKVCFMARMSSVLVTVPCGLNNVLLSCLQVIGGDVEFNCVLTDILLLVCPLVLEGKVPNSSVDSALFALQLHQSLVRMF
jgi:hypothetical protein